MMDTDKIVEHLLTVRHLSEDDFYRPTVFYYLAGRFPDLTISQCVDAVGLIRKRIISNY